MAQVGSRYSASTQRSHPVVRIPVKLDNTYKMDPDNQFPVTKVKRIITDVLQSMLCDESYDASKCLHLTKQIADIIKDRVKALKTPRYKIVCYVYMGSLLHGSVHLASQCVWNEKYDSYAEGKYTNKSLYSTAIVYGLYCE
uniref:Tctex1 domain-containing protein 1-B-like n=1 Tax=Saccoglossus kowalevskii TaxID=10224 RepID=A0ABM0GYG6_SACKO|nr:PREDICTED: tctex1 domain-containing protein 1-B-like [Saccoglossus kowalevskii]